MAVLLVFLSAGIVAIWVLVYLLYRNGTSSSSHVERELLPPGTKGWPLIGETLLFLKPHPVISTGPFIQKHRLRYGNIFRADIFGHPTIVSADPDFNKFILQNENRLFQSSPPSAVHALLGQWSLSLIAGDEHKLMHSMAVSFFMSDKLADRFLGEIERQAMLTLQSWHTDKILSLVEETRKFVFNVQAKKILGLNPGEPGTTFLMQEYGRLTKGLLAIPMKLPGTSYSNALRSRSRIVRIIKETLAARNQTPHGEYDDFLDFVIKDGRLTIEQVIDLVMSMLFGGYDTTNVAITLAMRFLAESPAAMKDLRVEHEGIRATKRQEKNTLSLEDYKRMEFTHCVIKETLRLGNIMPILRRNTLQDVSFKGYTIPKGWKVMPSFAAVHLDQATFKDPLRFDPWRWQGTQNCRSYFTPFGGGGRYCAGAHLVKLEMAVFLHYAVLDCDWTLAEPDDPVASPLVAFKKGLPIKVTKLCEG